MPCRERGGKARAFPFARSKQFNCGSENVSHLEALSTRPLPKDFLSRESLRRFHKCDPRREPGAFQKEKKLCVVEKGEA